MQMRTIQSEGNNKLSFLAAENYINAFDRLSICYALIIAHGSLSSLRCLACVKPCMAGNVEFDHNFGKFDAVNRIQFGCNIKPTVE